MSCLAPYHALGCWCCRFRGRRNGVQIGQQRTISSSGSKSREFDVPITGHRLNQTLQSARSRGPARDVLRPMITHWRGWTGGLSQADCPRGIRGRINESEPIHGIAPLSKASLDWLDALSTVFFSRLPQTACTRGAKQNTSFCVSRATRHGSSRAVSVGLLYKETALREIGWMKREFTVVAAVALGCFFSVERLCAETEPGATPATETAPSAPGIIVTPPFSILPRPEMAPPSNSSPPPSSPAPSCPATDRKLELIG